MGLDFFGVFLKGQIRTFESTGGKSTLYDLWTDIPDSDTGNALLPPDLRALSYVSQITTEMRLGMNAKISLVLTPPFEEGLAFLDSRLVQWGIGQLTVSFGYKTGSTAGNVAGPFIGLMQKPSVSIGTDITITLNALGVGYALNLIGSGDPRIFDFGYSYADAVRTLLEEVTHGHGVSISGLYEDFDEYDQADPFFRQPAMVAKSNSSFSGSGGAKKRDAKLASIRTEYENRIKTLREEKEKRTTSDSRKAEIDREIEDLLLEQVLEEDKVNAQFAADTTGGQINVGPRSSWWFIHETLRNYGKELLIKGSEVKVVDSAKWLRRTEAEAGGWRKHFILRGYTDPNRNMFPILAFNSPTTAVYLSPGVGKIAQQDVADDKDRKNATKKTYDTGNTPTTQTGDGEPETDAVTPLATVPTDALKNMPGSPHDPMSRAAAYSEFKKMNMEGGIRAEVTTLGIPDLLPAEVVQISGFLPRGRIAEATKKGTQPARGLFDGPYGIIRVTHTVGTGGYTTAFEAVSNFYPAEWMNARKTKAAVTDIQEPAPDGAQDRIDVEGVEE